MFVKVETSSDKKDLVEERVVEKLEYAGINEYKFSNSLELEVEKEEVPEVIRTLSFLSGVDSLTPFEKSGGEPGEVVEKILEMFPSKEGFKVNSLGYNESKEVEESLEEGEFEVFLEQGEDCVKVFSESFEGVGGLPVEKEKTVVLKLEDRFDAVAGVLLTLDGYNVQPVYTGNDVNKVEEGVLMLKEYNPVIKLIFLKKADLKEALESSRKVVKTDLVGFGSVDSKSLFEECSFDIINPIYNMGEEEVLELYTEYRRLPLDS